MSSSKNMIYDSILFIEGRLSDELNINELAGQIFFSKSHYKRLFQAVIGESVMEYVKKRRLQRAGIMLCETNASVLEISLQFGYTSHEGFSRAFSEYFGMPPTKYRKRYAAIKSILYHEEAMNMITSEARKNITQYANDIAKDWEILIYELEKGCAPAKKLIENDRRTTGGMAVAFEEWRNLILRMNSVKNETIQLLNEETNIYDLHDKTNALMKTLDDIIFQMNLLRFLTGSEWSRMGEHGIPFKPILDKLTTLCETENKRKESAVKLVLEINALIRTEIKREAVSCIKQATEAMCENAKEGTLLTEKLNTLVVELGMHGRGFALLAKETEKAAFYVRESELTMQRIADDMDKKDNELFSSRDQKFIHIAIMQLEDSAFKMNVNAFNSAVETARAGEAGEPGCRLCAEGIKNYAYKLHKAYEKCKGLFDDCIKLVALLRNEGKNTDNGCLQKFFDDILFQAGILNTQLSLESERSGRSDFRTLSQDFEKALNVLKDENQRNEQINKNDIIKAYNEKLSLLTQRGNALATAAGNYGVGIAYIVNEFNQLTIMSRGYVEHSL